MDLCQYILEHIDDEYIKFPEPDEVKITLDGLCMIAILHKLGRFIIPSNIGDFTKYEHGEIIYLMFKDYSPHDNKIRKRVKGEELYLLDEYKLHGTIFKKVKGMYNCQGPTLKEYDKWNELFMGTLPPIWNDAPNTDYTSIDAIYDIHMQENNDHIKISWDYQDAIDNNFLIYINLLIMKGKYIILDEGYGINIRYAIREYHEIYPKNGKRYSTHILLLCGLINANV